MPKAKIMPHIAAPIIKRIVENTAARYGVGWKEIMAKKRGRPKVASARVVAMAVSRAVGVPTHVVARAFGRTWQTVDSARESSIRRCSFNEDAREEFIAIISQSLKP